MRCETARTELKALADGELNPLASWQVRRHLARCPRCTGEFASLGRGHELLRAGDLLPLAPAPRAASVAPPPPVRPRWQPMLAGLALGAAAVVGAFWPHAHSKPPVQMARIRSES